MAADWYVRVDGEQYGPYTSDQLKTYATEGHITRGSEIRRGGGAWCLATKVKGMFPNENVAALSSSSSPPYPSSPPPSPVSFAKSTVARAVTTSAGIADSERELYSDSPAMFRNHPIGFVLSLVLCIAGVGVILLIVWYLRCRGTHLTVTNKRTTLRTGILSKHINEVFHRDVRNVRLSQSFWQRILGVGSVELSSSGQSDVEIAVSGMPNPDNIKILINKYRDG